MSVLIFFMSGSVAGTRGRRSTFSMRSMAARAALMPVGFPLLEEGGNGLAQVSHYLFGAVVVARGGQIDHT